MISKKSGIILLCVLVAVLAIAGLLIDPIPQDPSYHDFADQAAWMGIPSALNVLSNVPFAIVGILGVVLLSFPGRVHFVDRRERWPWMGFSIGLIIVFLGSSYYHLAPDNSRLVWDRLPLTFIFMTYVAALVCERISVELGLWSWPLLCIIGILSVWQWYVSEQQGAGDMRLYLAVQIFALTMTAVILLTPSPYDHAYDVIIAVLFFVLSHFFEKFDREVYQFTQGFISGHTLKHLSAAMAGFWLIRMLKKRKILTR